MRQASFESTSLTILKLAFTYKSLYHLIFEQHVIFHHVLRMWVVKSYCFLCVSRKVIFLFFTGCDMDKCGVMEGDDSVDELLAEMDSRHSSCWRWWFVVWSLRSCSTLMSWRRWRLFKLEYQATWSVRSALLFLQGPNSLQSKVRRCANSGARVL